VTPTGTPVTELTATPGAGSSGAGRWELLRALGVVMSAVPPSADHLHAALKLPPWSRAEHTQAFTLELPPFASVHLGPEGKLGGEGADRVAGLWRALGLDPPADADHLGNLLSLLAELGEAEARVASDATRRRLAHARATLLWEHLWSWVPGYLTALRRHHPATAPWAELVARAVTREATATEPAAALPLALRAAPPPPSVDGSAGELLDALTVPVRTGFVLTASDVAVAAGATGSGLRRGERCFALRALFEQDPAATLRWLADHAAGWARRHRCQPPVAHDPAPWWAARASHTAGVLAELAGLAEQGPRPEPDRADGGRRPDYPRTARTPDG
jgi:hypothetical protein